MSKQSSLMSFFTPKGGSATPKTPIATGPPKGNRNLYNGRLDYLSVETDSSKKTVSTPMSSRAPLKRVNERVKMDEQDSNVVEVLYHMERIDIIENYEERAEASTCYYVVVF